MLCIRLVTNFYIMFTFNCNSIQKDKETQKRTLVRLFIITPYSYDNIIDVKHRAIVLPWPNFGNNGSTYVRLFFFFFFSSILEQTPLLVFLTTQSTVTNLRRFFSTTLQRNALCGHQTATFRLLSKNAINMTLSSMLENYFKIGVLFKRTVIFLK